jgi:hypothetical protein
MEYLFPILGIAFAFVLIKYREQIGDVFGDPDWLRPIGGVHYTIVYIAIFIIFWSISSMTGTTSVLFRPILWLFPTVRSGAGATDLSY